MFWNESLDELKILVLVSVTRDIVVVVVGYSLLRQQW